ncbi:MAG TPA: glutaredoxin family protein [Vicinamibacteria bacterium]|jgi:thiol-disulfide isomerase/thioredoxin
MWFQPRGSRSVELVLYSKPGCHLCDEMMTVVHRVIAKAGGVAATVREVDISLDPELSAVYADQIPVLFVNGSKAFKYRLTEEALRDRLKKETARDPGP